LWRAGGFFLGSSYEFLFWVAFLLFDKGTGLCVRQSDLAVMRLLDEQYTHTPQYGVERMTAWLKRKGIVVGHNRVRRLIRLMGLEAIYPKPRLSQPGRQEHRKHPYLLRGLTIDPLGYRHITYIRLWQGFV